MNYGKSNMNNCINVICNGKIVYELIVIILDIMVWKYYLENN